MWFLQKNHISFEHASLFYLCSWPQAVLNTLSFETQERSIDRENTYVCVCCLCVFENERIESYVYLHWHGAVSKDREKPTLERVSMTIDRWIIQPVLQNSDGSLVSTLQNVSSVILFDPVCVYLSFYSHTCERGGFSLSLLCVHVSTHSLTH
jgi:hypothetical protein